MDLVSVLKTIGIQCKITVPNRIATTDLPHVDAKDARMLTKDILRINRVLHDHDLLGKWRAKQGGTTTSRWILIVGSNGSK